MYKSLKVALTSLAKARLALRQHCFPSQNSLAHELGLSRSTIGNFFTGKPISYLNFIEISQRLELDWQAIAELKTDEHLPSTNIDILVQKVRQQYASKIQTLYGKIQLLNLSQPIDLNHFFVPVDILEKPIYLPLLNTTNLLPEFNTSNLAQVWQQRTPALEKVKTCDRLIVLGKPGSGKTTFLQYLTIACLQNQLENNRVPFFLNLKNFAEYVIEQGNCNLLNYLCQELESCGITEVNIAETLLKQGKGWILLDGLDEIPQTVQKDIIKEIRHFCYLYYHNKIIVSCRLATFLNYFIQENFTIVEIANFNQLQQQAFVKNWFEAIAQSHEQGEYLRQQFLAKLEYIENLAIRELSFTPFLLHLICLTFYINGKLLLNHTKLLEQELGTLLIQWDESKGIQVESYH